MHIETCEKSYPFSNFTSLMIGKKMKRIPFQTLFSPFHLVHIENEDGVKWLRGKHTQKWAIKTTTIAVTIIMNR
jgi:hypothetical protein